MSFLNTYQKQVAEYGGGGGEGGLSTITKNVVTSGTKTYLDFEIPFGVTEISIQGQFVLQSTTGFPNLYIQFSSDGVSYSTPVSLNNGLNSLTWLNESLLTSTLGIFWYNLGGQLIETLLQVPTTARIYAAKQITPTLPVPWVNLTSINIVTTSFP